MSFGDHLEELRTRLIWALGGILPIFVLALLVAAPLLEILTEPLLAALRAQGEPALLQATSPIETFLAYLKVALVVTLLVGFPWIVYQVWLFVAPGLYAHERRFAYFLVPASAFLTASAAAFLYTVMLPLSLFFLIGFGAGISEREVPSAPLPQAVAVEDLERTAVPVLDADPPEALWVPGMTWLLQDRQMLRVVVAPGRAMSLPLRNDSLIAQEYRIGEYVGLVFWLGLVFAIAFQLPLVMLLAGWTGLVDARMLGRFRKHVGFGCAAAGAIFTPQDPWSMLVLGGVLYLLFEVGLVLMRFVPASRVAGPEDPMRGDRWTDGDEGDA